MTSFFPEKKTVSQSVRNHPSRTRSAHSFCRAARGSWQIFEEAQELRLADKLPRHAPLSPSCRCSRHRRRGRHRPASRSAAFSADLVTLAVGLCALCRAFEGGAWAFRRSRHSFGANNATLRLSVELLNVGFEAQCWISVPRIS